MQTASVSLALDLMFYTSVLEHLQSETAPCSASATGYQGAGGREDMYNNVNTNRAVVSDNNGSVSRFNF